MDGPCELTITQRSNLTYLTLPPSKLPSPLARALPVLQMLQPVIQGYRFYIQTIFKLTLPSYCNIPILAFILEFWILSFIQHILTVHWLLVYSATHWAGGRDMRQHHLRTRERAYSQRISSETVQVEKDEELPCWASWHELFLIQFTITSLQPDCSLSFLSQRFQVPSSSRQLSTESVSLCAQRYRWVEI